MLLPVVTRLLPMVIGFASIASERSELCHTLGEGAAAYRAQEAIAFQRIDSLFSIQEELYAWMTPTPIMGSHFPHNRGAVLGSRTQVPWDDHVQTLLQLGARISKNAGKFYLHIPSLMQFAVNYNLEVDRKVELGILGSSDVVYIGIPLMDPKTLQMKNYRPGLDLFPGPRDLHFVFGEAVSSGGQMDHYKWAGLLNDQFLLLHFDLIDHTLAHATDYLANPEKTALVLKFYRDRKPEFQTLEQRRQDYARIFLVEESLALPRLELSDYYKKELPFLFNPQGSPGDFFEEAQRLIQVLQPTLRLSGGSVRDSYNRFTQLTPLWSASTGGSRSTQVGGALSVILKESRVIGDTVTTESLMAKIELLKLALFEIHARYSSQMKTYLRTSISSPLHPLYRLIPEDYSYSQALAVASDLRRSIELIVTNTLALNVTPESILEDMLQDVPAQSSTAEFFRRCYVPGSPTYRAFVK